MLGAGLLFSRMGIPKWLKVCCLGIWYVPISWIDTYILKISKKESGFLGSAAETFLQLGKDDVTPALGDMMAPTQSHTKTRREELPAS